jgi:hypothetical protein
MALHTSNPIVDDDADALIEGPEQCDMDWPYINRSSYRYFVGNFGCDVYQNHEYRLGCIGCQEDFLELREKLIIDLSDEEIAAIRHEYYAKNANVQNDFQKS